MIQKKSIIKELAYLHMSMFNNFIHGMNINIL